MKTDNLKMNKISDSFLSYCQKFHCPHKVHYQQQMKNIQNKKD